VDIIGKAVGMVEAVAESTNPSGEFDVILSAQTEDRDGDVLASDEWKTPLPEHITFDSDHGMSVETTVGSGRPFINEDGDLQVRGSYASTPHAQNVRTLVVEGHIRTTSVAFMTSKKMVKGAKPERELLNGAFVAIPSNREAVVLSSKSLIGLKVGARTSNTDMKMVQAIHDASSGLGADCAASDDSAGEKSLMVVSKSISGSVEDLRDRISNALTEAVGPDSWPWIRATFLDDGGMSGTVVYEMNGDTLARTFADDGTVTTLDDKVRDVSIITSVVDESDATKSAIKSPADLPAEAAKKATPSGPADLPAEAAKKAADEVVLRGRLAAFTATQNALASSSTGDK
jgi:hypothetical protein